MPEIHASFGEVFGAIRNELFLFAATFFVLGAIDEWLVDAAYFGMRITGKAKRLRLDEADLATHKLQGIAALFIPAWKEDAVIEITLRHAGQAWPQDELRIYVGCYPNDPATQKAVRRAAADDPRITLVVHERPGPTCKADCLNELYKALVRDEQVQGFRARMVVMQDAEDCVDPYALPLLDRAISDAEFVQLPVLALPNRSSPFIAGHYSDEFAENHAKTLVVRSLLGAGVPGAGVGSAIERDTLEALGRSQAGEAGALSDRLRPFADDSLTEDYELGLNIAALGGRSRYLRARTLHGHLIATRAYFPSTIETSVRQKTRWIHGVALQSWDRMGWRGGAAGAWMALRDRRGPFAALLLLLGYSLSIVALIDLIATRLGLYETPPYSDAVEFLLIVALGAVVWRAAMRAYFTTREFGWRQGLLSIPRLLVSNVISIMAGWRAVLAYWRSRKGEAPRWDKTEHTDHPALATPT